eukprot:84730-Pyramimonas_sp.AAC.1
MNDAGPGGAADAEEVARPWECWGDVGVAEALEARAFLCGEDWMGLLARGPSNEDSPTQPKSSQLLGLSSVGGM